MKHNKKRNTAFIYEALIKEVTKSIIEKDATRKNCIIAILKENFGKGTTLGKELELYKALSETKNTQLIIAEKILHETKIMYARLDTQKLFEAQSDLIAKINKRLGGVVWSNFVANYKALASINAIFSSKTPVKTRVLFEQALVDAMVAPTIPEGSSMKPLDNLTYRSFIKKFNDRYSDLLEEQRNLLNNYVASFADDGFELRVYLNEELRRLKKVLGDVTNSSTTEELIKNKTTEVLNYLEEFKTREMVQKDFQKILTVQALVQEFQDNDQN